METDCLERSPMPTLLKAGIAVVACVCLTLGCGGAKQAGTAADDIARKIRAATPGPADVNAACDALDVWSSKPAESLPELLKQSANQEGVDPSDAHKLITAADGIKGSQLASNVLSALGC